MATFTSNKVSASNIYLQLTITETVNTASNSSTLNWSLKAISSAYWNVVNSGMKFTVNIGGNVKTFQPASISMSGAGTYNVGSGNCTIPHEVDGTKTVSVKASSSGVFAAMTINSTMTLTKIGRRTEFTLNPNTVAIGEDEAMIIDTSSRASSTFTHQIFYDFGSVIGVQIGDNVATSAAWIPPESLGNQIPHDKKGNGGITVITKDGNGKEIGRLAKPMYLTVGEKYKPVINSFTIADTNEAVKNKFGVFVQNKSALKITPDASGQLGTTIKGYKATIGGVLYNIDNPYPCPKSGTIAYNITAIDSRDYETTSTNKNISVVEYFDPQITTIQVVRCKANGTTDAFGEYIKCSYGFKIAPVSNKNDRLFRIEYYEEGSWKLLIEVSDAYEKSTRSNWHTVTEVTNLYRTGAGSAITKNPVRTDVDIPIRYVVSDFFTSVTKTITLEGVDKPMIDMSTTNGSVAIGDLARDTGTTPYFDVHYESNFKKDAIFDGSIAIGNTATFYSGPFNAKEGAPGWVYLGNFDTSVPSASADIKIYTGNGYDGEVDQNSIIHIMIKKSLDDGTTSKSFAATYWVEGAFATGTQLGKLNVEVRCPIGDNTRAKIYVYIPWEYGGGDYDISLRKGIWTHMSTFSTSSPSSGAAQPIKNITADMRGYPVGSILWLQGLEDPADLFGGTWTEFYQSIRAVQTGGPQFLNCNYPLQQGKSPIIYDWTGSDAMKWKFGIAEKSQSGQGDLHCWRRDS